MGNQRVRQPLEGMRFSAALPRARVGDGNTALPTHHRGATGCPHPRATVGHPFGEEHLLSLTDPHHACGGGAAGEGCGDGAMRVGAALVASCLARGRAGFTCGRLSARFDFLAFLARADLRIAKLAALTCIASNSFRACSASLAAFLAALRACLNALRAALNFRFAARALALASSCRFAASSAASGASRNALADFDPDLDFGAVLMASIYSAGFFAEMLFVTRPSATRHVWAEGGPPQAPNCYI